MKIRVFLITLLLLSGFCLKAQPPETIYQGTLIASGYRQNILMASDGPFPIGFNFTFFGNVYTQFYVSANGLVMFEDPTAQFNDEADIPAISVPNNYIAPFWDNLSIMDGGNVMYKTVGASSNGKCIIQFKNMGFDPIPTPLGTFSVILYENTNVIQMQYRLITDPYTAQSHGESATIGIENAAGSAGVKYAFHSGNAVHSEHAISFTPSGSTYIANGDATYDGVFLTTNPTLPDPGITNLISPAEDAIVGASQAFSWSAATNASAYYLVIDTFPTLATATYYNAGTNLSYNVTGLKLNKTWYYTVFAYNATATTWGEVRRFSTTLNPPLTAVPTTMWVVQGSETIKKLQYSGGDAGAKTAIITSLPAQGTLWQVSGGLKSTQVTSVPATVSDAEFNIIYAATGGTGNGAGNFKFKFHDGTGDSPEATITVNISPAAMPNFLYAAKTTTYIEIQFDRAMSDPSGKQSQFTATVNGTPVTISSLALKPGDPNTIIAALPSSILLTDAVTIKYTAGDITSTQGGLLATFLAQTVSLQAQTINFTQSLSKKFNESPFTLSATASSGLSLTYSSSNTSVATIAGSTVTLKALGTSDITARQAGDATYAPANYTRTLTVSKGDQTITFGPLAGKTTADVDFTLSATATSGLTITYTSTNTAVATVTGNTVHIAGAGSTVITASQPGSSLWNAAADVPQTLVVTFPVGVENPVIQARSFNIYSIDNFIYIRTLDDEWDGKTGSLKIVDIAGRIISNLKNIEFSKNSLVQIHAGEGQGIYLVEIRNGLKRFTGKVVVR